MIKHYEQLITTTDPFCIMCGEGPEYDISYWEAISLDELKIQHEGGFDSGFLDRSGTIQSVETRTNSE